MNINETDIAIIGISGRFPGANTIDEFWQNLRNGVESISEFCDAEIDIDDRLRLNDPNYVKSGAVLSDIDLFDAEFFGYSAKEAEIMDPQQRLFLECAWEAFENAGYNPQTYEGLVGVYAGSGMNTYLLNNVHPNRQFSAYRTFLESARDLQVRLANGKDYLPTRVSYKLNLTGPSLNVQTACSSSLVAVHLACQSLLNGECDMALAGGIAISVPQKTGYLYQEGMISSKDGHCRAFDAEASGTVFGNGGGIVLLKLLQRAMEDGDKIYATIKGSAVNNDGALKVGYTAPSVDGQAAAISEALAIANVEADTITYLETHGTGTALGDPIEIAALTQAFRLSTDDNGFCAIASVKTNIGHLLEAAGIAGLIKTVLALKHQQIPPSLHFNRPNPNINFANSPFYVNTQLSDWQASDSPRRAGVSSFGMGGTNAHVVLEEAPVMVDRSGECDPLLGGVRGGFDRPVHLLTLSAKNETALRELARRTADYLASDSSAKLADICFTANTGRVRFDRRLAIVARSKEQLQQDLATVSPDMMGQKDSHSAPKIAFLFTGQGSQYVGMGRQLYDSQPTFQEAIDRCDAILRSLLDIPLLDVLYPDLHKNAENSAPSPLSKGGLRGDSHTLLHPIDETRYTQPALFALEYALVQLWRSWGVEPDFVMGHSIGEVVAACVAGVFSLEDALKLIAERGRLMQELSRDGEMVALLASFDEVSEAIAPYQADISIAAINGPESITISGKTPAIEEVCSKFDSLGIKTKKLTVSHAFHSPLMEPMLAQFDRVARQLDYATPTIPLISNVTGELADDRVSSPDYWVRHVREAVRFAPSMKTLERCGANVLLEVGPKPILLGMGLQCLETECLCLPSLRPNEEDWQQLLSSLAELYRAGWDIDWHGFDRDYIRVREHLPTYPFQRQRYWLDTPQWYRDGMCQGNSPEKDRMDMDPVSTPNREPTTPTERSRRVETGSTHPLPQATPSPTQSGNHRNPPLAQPRRGSIASEYIASLHEVRWQASPQPSPLEDPLLGGVRGGSLHPTPNHWLIFADAHGTSDRLRVRLHERGSRTTIVVRGDKYQQIEEGLFILNPQNPEHFEQLLQGVRDIDGIIHLWSLDAPSTETAIDLEDAATIGLCSTLHLVQSMVKTDAELPLWLVTRGAQSVGETAAVPGISQSPLWGMRKAIALEYPELQCCLIDLDPDNWQGEEEFLVAEIVGNQIDPPPTPTHSYPSQEGIQSGIGNQIEEEVAVRDRIRYVPRLVPFTLNIDARDRVTPIHLEDNSSYLITGGLGGLGLRVAQTLAERGAKHLVLLGRSAPNPEVKKQLEDLERSGVRVTVAQADLCDRTDLASVLEDIDRTLPPLRGVIHAAGVVDFCGLWQQDWNRFARGLAAKVQGTWNLHVLTGDRSLNFFVCFSSLASLLGSHGLASYGAANGFMDAIAHHRRALGLPGLSINWGPWGEVGMNARLSDEHKRRLSAWGLNEISPDRGLATLMQLLPQQFSQVAVLPIDWSKWLTQFSRVPLFYENVTQDSGDVDVEPASIAFSIASLPETQRRSRLVSHLRSAIAKTLGLKNAKQIGLETRLAQLGLDSLMAMELRNTVKSSLGCALPSAFLFKYPTLAELVDYLDRAILDRADEIEPTPNPTHPYPSQEGSQSGKPTPNPSQEGNRRMGKIDLVSTVVPIQPEGTQPPLFLVPGILGSVFDLYPLAKYLGNYLDRDRPVYGLRSFGSDENEQPFTRMEDIAAYHIKSIQDIQPQGPYFLGGHSFGGKVAFEIAQQLRSLGHDVGFLAPIDIQVGIPEPEKNVTSWDRAECLAHFANIYSRILGTDLGITAADLQRLDPDEQLNYVCLSLKIAGQPFTPTDLAQMVEIYKANTQASVRYQVPERDPMPMVLFRATEIGALGDYLPDRTMTQDDPTWGWEQAIGRSVQLELVPGNHFTMMREPHVRILAKRLQLFLETHP